MVSMQSTSFPIFSRRWLISSWQLPTSPLPISWNCTSAIFGNCTESCLYRHQLWHYVYSELHEEYLQGAWYWTAFLYHIPPSDTGTSWKQQQVDGDLSADVLFSLAGWLGRFAPDGGVCIWQSPPHDSFFCELWLPPDPYKHPKCSTVWQTWWTDPADSWYARGREWKGQEPWLQRCGFSVAQSNESGDKWTLTETCEQASWTIQNQGVVWPHIPPWTSPTMENSWCFLCQCFFQSETWHDSLMSGTVKPV